MGSISLNLTYRYQTPYTHRMNKPAILHTAKCLLIAATLGVAVGYLAHVGEAPGGPQKAGWMTFVLVMVWQAAQTVKTDKKEDEPTDNDSDK